MLLASFVTNLHFSLSMLFSGRVSVMQCTHVYLYLISVQYIKKWWEIISNLEFVILYKARHFSWSICFTSLKMVAVTAWFGGSFSLYIILGHFHSCIGHQPWNSTWLFLAVLFASLQVMFLLTRSSCNDTTPPWLLYNKIYIAYVHINGSAIELQIDVKMIFNYFKQGVYKRDKDRLWHGKSSEDDKSSATQCETNFRNILKLYCRCSLSFWGKSNNTSLPAMQSKISGNVLSAK